MHIWIGYDTVVMYKLKYFILYVYHRELTCMLFKKCLLSLSQISNLHHQNIASNGYVALIIVRIQLMLQSVLQLKLMDHLPLVFKSSKYNNCTYMHSACHMLLVLL